MECERSSYKGCLGWNALGFCCTWHQTQWLRLAWPSCPPPSFSSALPEAMWTFKELSDGSDIWYTVTTFGIKPLEERNDFAGPSPRVGFRKMPPKMLRCVSVGLNTYWFAAAQMGHLWIFSISHSLVQGMFIHKLTTVVLEPGTGHPMHEAERDSSAFNIPVCISVAAAAHHWRVQSRSRA